MFGYLLLFSLFFEFMVDLWVGEEFLALVFGEEFEVGLDVVGEFWVEGGVDVVGVLWLGVLNGVVVGENEQVRFFAGVVVFVV